MEFEGSFGLAQEFFCLVPSGKIALKAATIDFSEVGFPFDDARGVAFLTDFHTNPSHKKGLGALKTIHVHPRFFCYSGAFRGRRCPGVARRSGA